MTQAEEDFEKILFRYDSPVLDKEVVETMWALKIDPPKGQYALDSIPFYGPQIATGDEFFAEYDETEQMLTYRKILRKSGNSVILVLIIPEDFDQESLRQELHAMNCSSEGLNNSYFALVVLGSSSYLPIKQRLDQLEKEGIIEYAEPCLSKKHQNE